MQWTMKKQFQVENNSFSGRRVYTSEIKDQLRRTPMITSALRKFLFFQSLALPLIFFLDGLARLIFSMTAAYLYFPFKK